MKQNKKLHFPPLVSNTQKAKAGTNSTVQLGECLCHIQQIVTPWILYKFVNATHLIIQFLCLLSINQLMYRMSENKEKCPSQFPTVYFGLIHSPKPKDM